MEKIYDVDHFIEKFEKIPEDKWCVEDSHKDNKRCALGHCGGNEADLWSDEAVALSDLLGGEVAEINDGYVKKYKQETPKQRILAALNDIKRMQESSQMPNSEQDVQECDATKMIVVPSAWPNKSSSLTKLIPIVDEVMDVKKVNQLSQ